MRMVSPHFHRPPIVTRDFSITKGVRSGMRLLFLILLLAIPTIVQAVSLPPASYMAHIDAEGSFNPDLSGPGSLTGGGCGPGAFNCSTAHATLAGTPVPLASAGASSSNDMAGAAGRILYSLEIAGGSGASPVTVDVTGFVSASASGDASGAAVLQIQETSGPVIPVIASWSACANTFDPFGCSGPTTINVNAMVTLLSNTLYSVEVGASGSAGGCAVPPCPLGTGDGGGSADPSFAIDPSTPDASLYSLVFSDGIGNAINPTPEPSTWLLVPTAVGLAWLARKKRKGTSTLA